MATNEIHDLLLSTYDKYMYLKIFVPDPQDNRELSAILSAQIEDRTRALKTQSHIDAGFDLPSREAVSGSPGNPLQVTIDFGVRCSATMVCDAGHRYNTGYYLYPRSSLAKTSLRLANSTGIIDAGYRGNILGKFDIVSTSKPAKRQAGQQVCRYAQLCAPGLVPIYAELVSAESDLGETTERGRGGFGSTGV